MKAVNAPKLMKDESDPNVMVLRRRDDAFVVTFSTRGATTKGIVEAAKQHYEALLLRQNAGALGPAAEEHRSA